MKTKKFLALALGAMMLCPMAEAMTQAHAEHLAELSGPRTSCATLKVAKKACIVSMLAGCGVGLWGVGKAMWGGCNTLFGSFMGLFGFWKSAASLTTKVVGDPLMGRDVKRDRDIGQNLEDGLGKAIAGTGMALNGANTGISGLGLALKGFGWAVGSGLGYLALDYADMKLKE